MDMVERDSQDARALRVMVVDDTKLFRLILVKVLNGIAGVKVVATAQHGVEAIETLRETDVDVVLLDVEMPELNGLETLKRIQALANPPECIMVSSHNKSNTQIAIEALSSGAYDMVPKPSGTNAKENEETLRQSITCLLRAISQERSLERLRDRSAARGGIKRGSGKEIGKQRQQNPGYANISEMIEAERQTRGEGKVPASEHPQKLSAPGKAILSLQDVVALAKANEAEAELRNLPVRERMLRRRQANQASASAGQSSNRAIRMAFDAVLIGVSTGGPAALGSMLPLLPGNLKVPVFIVQHMPEDFTAPLAERLNKTCKLDVVEATHNSIAKPGTAYIAPGGKHMVLKREDKHYRILLNEDAPVNACRPAVDVLFNAAADEFRKGALAVIMTGIGRDGANGVKALKQKNNAYVITQSQETCTVYGMPKSVDQAGLSDEQLEPKAIAKRITDLLR